MTTAEFADSNLRPIRVGVNSHNNATRNDLGNHNTNVLFRYLTIVPTSFFYLFPPSGDRLYDSSFEYFAYTLS